MKRKIIPPADGWKEGTYYIVDVSYGQGNMIHRAIFHSGFLTSKGEPGAYACFWQSSYEYEHKFEQASYVKVISEIGKLESFG